MEKYEKEYLRKLALRFAELSTSQKQQQLKNEWKRHNDMELVPPRVLIYLDEDGAWEEILPESSMKLRNPEARSLERQLKQKIYHLEHFHDDMVFEPVIYVKYEGEYTGYEFGNIRQNTAWGLEIKRLKTNARGGSYGFSPTLNTEKDFETFFQHKLDFLPDISATEVKVDMLNDIFSDILGVETVLHGSVMSVNLLEELVHLRGLEQLMLDLYDNADILMKVLEHMANSKLNLLRKLEAEGLLRLNNKDHYVGSGGIGYTSCLPRNGYVPGRVKLKDLWGFADAQEFTDVSAEMFRKFILPNQKKVLEEFGLVCYGCCERLDKKLDYILEIPNIRRISISPWTNIRIAADKIGRKCIYSRKPNPEFVSGNFEEDEIKKDLKEVLMVAADCNLEFILKDLRTCGGNPGNLSGWVNIAQSMCK